MNGTAEDLAKFAIALADKEKTSLFLKQQTLDTMFSQSYTPMRVCVVLHMVSGREISIHTQ